MCEYSREVLQATSCLCSSRGSMQLQQLWRELQLCSNISQQEFSFIVQECPRFLLVRGPAGDGGGRLEDCTVVAKTSLRLCRRYGREPCADCQQLHLCKFFIYGTCRFGKGRKPCKFSHDIRSDHNYRLLRECTLHQLHEDQLFLLLLQNDPALLPEVCSHYNKGIGPDGSCSFSDTCTKVHLCQHLVQGDCLFGPKCKRLHAVDERRRRLLEERGLSSDIIHDLPIIYRNLHHLTTASQSGDNKLRLLQYDIKAGCRQYLRSGGDSGFKARTEETNICLHFIRHSCKFQDFLGIGTSSRETGNHGMEGGVTCRKVLRPGLNPVGVYRWEDGVCAGAWAKTAAEFDGVTWAQLPDTEDIERAFCDPAQTQSDGAQPVNFLSMTRWSRPVRRLSTVSSVTKPPHYILTTEWRWFYRGDGGRWLEYGQPDEKQRCTSQSSASLEQIYLTDSRTRVPVVKGQRHYVISFTDMYQRNLKQNTKRRIRRRPRFVSAADVKNLIQHQAGPL
ncbi:protein mono-ADP-ribosyltransferase PARP12b [Scomber scombrus]|uniref:protein mono-ADP-ribosyltransferase PARP12b n=1 Tax=Scomber scombrus TaxID=13677 RepID=UPI002DDBB2AB|nr:protein mono-ADP-ribosyltransferase PARP12b [Scomber scombrus]